MVHKKYVVLYGARGVSNEFRTVNAAKKFAQNKANQRGEKVEIDRLTIYGRGDQFSQGHERYVKPNGKPVRRSAPARRPSNLMGGGFRLQPTGFKMPRFV